MADNQPTPPAPIEAVDLDTDLAAAWLTYQLPSETRRRLAGMAQRRAMAAGEILLHEGERDQSLAVVLSGRVGLRMRVPERGHVTILTVEPGDVVGWSAVVPPFRATSTAVVLVPGELAVFEAAALREMLATDHALAAELYPLLLQSVARRLEGTRLQLLDLFTP